MILVTMALVLAVYMALVQRMVINIASRTNVVHCVLQ